MRYAHNDFGSPPIGVEPQPRRLTIEVSDYNGANLVTVTDLNQMREVISLLRDGGRILGWDVDRNPKKNDLEGFKRMCRDNYDSFSAMRNDINEMFGDMISQEATLKDGPEMSAECAAVVVSLREVRARMRRLQRLADREKELRNDHIRR